MSYQNYRSGGYGVGGYSSSYNSGYSRSRGRNGYGFQGVKKHSGCRSKTVGDGVTVVYGWNYSRSRGLIVAYARPYNKTVGSVSKTGKKWMNYFVTVTNRRTNQITKTSGMFDVSNNRVYLKELNLVMSPGKNYFGRHLGGRR